MKTRIALLIAAGQLMCAASAMAADEGEIEGDAATNANGNMFSFGGGYSIGVENYSLSGSGFSGALPGIRSSNIFLGALYRRGQAVYGLRGGLRTASADVPSGFTPTSISPQMIFAAIDAGLTPWANGTGFFSRFSVGGGVEFRKRDAAATSPYVVYPSSTRAGVYGVARCWGSFSDSFGYEGRLAISIPIYFVESSAKTGAPSFQLNTGVKAAAVYHVSGLIDFALGAEIEVEQNVFTGSIARGTTNGAELITNAQIPLELRFKF